MVEGNAHLWGQNGGMMLGYIVGGGTDAADDESEWNAIFCGFLVGHECIDSMHSMAIYCMFIFLNGGRL